MRIGIAAATAGCILTGAFLALSIPANDGPHARDYSGFLEQIEDLDPNRMVTSAADGFSLKSAVWDEATRSLIVRATTNEENGMLLTLTGLPDSTWVDAFKISTDHAVEYSLPIPESQAVPCEVTVRSATVTEVISVINAPPACNNVLGIEGTVTAVAGEPMSGGLVTVTVGDTVFATITDSAGNYALEVYTESADELVTIMAEGRIGADRVRLSLYEGSIDGLLGPDGLRASVWATEIFGRRMKRRMLAAVTTPVPGTNQATF